MYIMAGTSTHRIMSLATLCQLSSFTTADSAFATAAAEVESHHWCFPVRQLIYQFLEPEFGPMNSSTGCSLEVE
jgi:hypothetical protein